MGDSDLSHTRRICSGIRGKRTNRAYNLTNTNAAFLIKVKTSLTFKLRRHSRDQSRRPRNVKLKLPKEKSNTLTPLKHIRSLTTLVRANWKPSVMGQRERKPIYVFSDYASSKPSAGYLSFETKEYLGFFDTSDAKKTEQKNKPEVEAETIGVATPRDLSYKVSKAAENSYQKSA